MPTGCSPIAGPGASRGAPDPVGGRLAKPPDLQLACSAKGGDNRMPNLLQATPLFAIRGVAIDAETTGLDVRRARMIEIAAIQFFKGDGRQAGRSILQLGAKLRRPDDERAGRPG